jgi:hypothetical protein
VFIALTPSCFWEPSSLRWASYPDLPFTLTPAAGFIALTPSCGRDLLLRTFHFGSLLQESSIFLAQANPKV